MQSHSLLQQECIPSAAVAISGGEGVNIGGGCMHGVHLGGGGGGGHVHAVAGEIWGYIWGEYLSGCNQRG